MKIFHIKKFTEGRLFLAAMLLLLLLCLFTSTSHAGTVSFNFTLASNCTTSAGAYKTDGTLIRTLWSKVPYNAGTYTYNWDGLDEQGLPLAAGSYKVKLISHNVNYQWEGVVGNTSTNSTGNNMYFGINEVRGMAFSSNKGFVASGYNERTVGMRWFNTATPQVPTLFPHYVDGTFFNFVATDGNYVYYTLGNQYDTSRGCFVIAWDLSNNTEVVFPSDTSYSPSTEFSFNSVLDFTSSSSNAPTGLAVQKSGDFLFVSHAATNEIRVFNKLSGAAVTTVTATSPGQLAATTSGSLFAICTVGGNRVVQKYTVNSGGGLTATGTITGLSNPLSIATSPDDSTIIVADGGSSQQVKAFSTTSPFTAAWTYGQAGGFLTNGPTVTNDKLWFRNDSTFVAYQADGSFWVEDSSCFRSLHFSAARAYIDQISYIPHNYVTTVDQQNPNRLFAEGWLEYSIDYTKSVQQGWTLTKNWAAGQFNTGTDSFEGLDSVVTLSNGKTYALVTLPSGSVHTVMELTSTGLRSTGITLALKTPSITLNSDGSLQYEDTSSGVVTFHKRALTGFDGSNNPIWATATNVASLAYVDGSDPVHDYPFSSVGVRTPVTSSGVLVSFDNDRTHTGWHLGGIDPSTNKWLWKVSPTGVLDGLGSFDPNVNYGGNSHWTADRSIIYGFHGEGYNGGQAGQWMHYYDNGLFVGQFGVPNFPYDVPAAGQSGNNINWITVQQGGNLYIYNGCEAVGGGTHRWKINNWNSIAEQIINVTIAATGNGTGLTGMYFTDNNLTNLNFTRNDATVDFNWGTGSPDAALPVDNFSVRWMGSIEPRYSENYTFYTQSADGVRLYINGTQIINNWTAHASTENTSATVALQAGKKYRIVMETQDLTSSALAKLSWSSTSQTKQVVPVAQLYPLQPIAINSGSTAPTYQNYVADRFYNTGGTHIENARFGTFDASARNAAPDYIYWTTRFVNASTLTYTIPSLVPNSPCAVRLHFAEELWSDTTHRLGDVAINGTTVLSNFSVYGAAGNSKFKAVVRQFPAVADSTGKVTILLSGFGFQTSAIEVYGHQQYEFENGTLASGASLQSKTPASAGVLVGGFNNGGSSATLNNVFCTTRRQATLAIRYATGVASGMSVIVNGVNVGQCAFPVTGGWGDAGTEYGTAYFNVTLNPNADNSIAIKHDIADSGAVNIDMMTIQ